MTRSQSNRRRVVFAIDGDTILGLCVCLIGAGAALVGWRWGFVVEGIGIGWCVHHWGRS